METKVYHTVDKTQWPDGPWKEEVDKMQYEDPTTGMPCLVVRGPSGALCGYVGVPESHPCYKKSYNEVNVEAHGGLTYSALCTENEHGICHIPGEGEPDNVWWLGYDCAHLGDLCPAYQRFGLFGYDETYRDIDYVMAQNADLARQLAAMR